MSTAQFRPPKDETAFALLFDQHKNLVFRTAYLMLDDPQEAEDAVQEVFLQVHRSLDTYRPEKAAFSTWLHRITVNHCLNRRRSRRRTVPLDRVSHLASEARDVGDQLAEDELVRQALGRLSENLRAVVVLRYYADLPYATIAEVLELPLGTVKSRLNQALFKFRGEIEALTAGQAAHGDRLVKESAQ